MDRSEQIASRLFKSLRGSNAELRALANVSRQRLIVTIARTSPNKVLKVAELADKVGLSQPATSHHLRILREAGIVSAERRGNEVYYQLTPKGAVKALSELSELLGTLTP